MFQLGVATRLQQVDLIAELKKKQVSPQVREGKDGTIEDIITGTSTYFALCVFHIFSQWKRLITRPGVKLT